MLSTLPPTACVTAERIFAQVFWFGVFALQAPILGPYAFGLIAVVMAFIGFWEAVPGVSAIDALISIRNVDHRHFSTVTATCSLVCLAFGAAIFVFADALAAMLGDGQLASIMRAMAVLPLLQALSIAPVAAAQRDLRFQLIALRSIASLFAGATVGLALTWLGAGVWALVWQALVQRSVAAIVLWFAAPISLRFGISRHHFREIAAFALPLMLARTMNWVEGQIPRLLLGVYLGPERLGLLGLASRLNGIVSQVAIGPKALVAGVGLQEFASDPEALGKALARVFRHITVLTFPLCLGGAALAPTLFHAWLDARWLEGVVPSQLILLVAMPYITFYVTAAALLAVNRPHLEAGISTAQTLSILVVVGICGRFGLVAVAAAIAVRSLALLPFPLFLMRRRCGVLLRYTLLPQAPAFVASCLMAAVILLVRDRLEAAVGSMAALFILIFGGAGVYAILIAAMMPKPMAKLIRNVTDAVLNTLTASLAVRRSLRSLGIERLLYYRHRVHTVRTMGRFRRDAELLHLLSQLRKKNLVFTVTAGRTGTMYAYKLFSLLPDTTSQHEPEPAFHAQLRRIERDCTFAKKFLVRYKLPAIAEVPTTNYIELSHAFCKGFLEPMLELEITPKLLLLRREPRLIALSYLERYTVPERTFYGMEFLLSPRYSRALPLTDWRRMTDYQLIFWYALEVERRQRLYSQLVLARGGVVCDVSAVELNNFRCFMEVATDLHLIGDGLDWEAIASQHAAVSRVCWNKNDGAVWRYQADLDREEETVWEAVSQVEPELRSWVEGRDARASALRDEVITVVAGPPGRAKAPTGTLMQRPTVDASRLRPKAG
jgi:O-antigen/teichoic acid export membrane protein